MPKHEASCGQKKPKRRWSSSPTFTNTNGNKRILRQKEYTRSWHSTRVVTSYNYAKKTDTTAKYAEKDITLQEQLLCHQNVTTAIKANAAADQWYSD